ncbi:glycoside hydrolase family 38 C-terminal domain-containing protein [Kitasatospora sp. LaBMicrA B282]|uniref:glycoside hydrolase family 38 N-terminal domain-containing protein n=1 Tax=Kitasatospora sp. LaBMicrA B282 TaxID=3420949 RepID=UPI003D0EF497
MTDERAVQTTDVAQDGGLARRRFLSLLAVASAAVVGVEGGAVVPAHADVTVPEAVPVPLPHDLAGASYDRDRAAADFDGYGWCYPAEQLPSGRTLIAGVPFAFPSYGPGTKNFLAAHGQTLTLPAGRYSLLYVIGAASNGDADRMAELHYADGSSVRVPLRLTDWTSSPRFLEAVAVEATHRHQASGDCAPRVRLFLQVVPCDPLRVAQALVLPDDGDLKLIALSAQPAVAGAALKVTAVASTELFTGSREEPRQVVQVSVANIGSRPVGPQDAATVQLSGEGVRTPEPAVVRELAPGGQETVEVGVVHSRQQPDGVVLPAAVRAATRDVVDTQSVRITAAEPGWTMFMVPHFHYDPVWWNTQGAITETWENAGFQRPGLTLMRAHLDMARRDPDYKLALAELDYLKPFWDGCPEDRDHVRHLLAERRLELVGGLYNEPSTNLTSVELTIRSAVYGMGYQRDVLGGSPCTAWQLDVFGHDPQFPGIMADAGHTSSSWARGPHHEWGPKGHVGDNRRMQFRSEFDWIAPSGRSLLTSYMPNHYSAGWEMDSAETLEAAEATAYELFRDLKSVAATRNCLLPVGTDYAPPNRWVTRVHRSWAERYTWPRFVTAVPGEFFDAVRRDLAASGTALSPQTRDMNPIFTGKDITFIDTKQAQREAENTLLAAERFATVAALLGARYPGEAFDKAWRQLCFGAHHDAITGSESDQVYLDLLGGWREALELARTALDGAQAFLAARADTRGAGTPLLVFNPMAWRRTDLARAAVSFPAPGPAGLALADPQGRPVPAVADRITRHPDGSIATARLSFVAREVPATGYATHHVVAAQTLPAPQTLPAATGWTAAGGLEIENEYYRLAVDPARGGVITSLYDRTAGKQMLRPGGCANELLAYDEYRDGPGAPAGGPWVTVPKGAPVARSSDRPATVTVEQSPIGRRVTVQADFAQCRFTQRITLWQGVDRIDLSTRIDGYTGTDRLLRVRFQPAVTGGMPVAEVGDAVVGRGFGFPDVDYAETPWTLDYPAYNWVELGATLVVALTDSPGGAQRAARAVSVAELVVPDATAYNTQAREAVTALVATGVTATTSTHDGPRYGSLDVDSNLPDLRISVGSATENRFTAAVLAAAAPGYRAELDRGLSRARTARVWVPAARPLADVWLPNADLRDPLALPVLVIAGRTPADTRAALHELAAELRRAPRIEVVQPAELDGTTGQVEPYGFAVLNRGLPGYTAAPCGDLYLGLLRSSTGWPSGTWIDPPRRRLPDGAAFQTNHWSHTFEYALIGHHGDWREAGLARRGHAYNTPFTTRQETAHPGSLPAAAELLATDGESVVVTACKPRGNPMAAMAGTEQDPRQGLVIRAYESSGRPTTARFTFVRPLTTAVGVDLLEAAPQAAGGVRAQGGRIDCTFGAFEIRTLAVTAEPTLSDIQGPRGTELAPATEPAQPVYAPYWRHNKGAAPMGYQMTTIQASPEAVTGTGPYDLDITLASSHTRQDATGTVELVLPPGWSATPATRMYSLAPGAHLRYTARVRPAGPGGRYFVGVRTKDTRGQAFEDVVTVDHTPTARAADLPLPLALPGSEPDHPLPETPRERDQALSIDRVTRKARLVVPAQPTDSPDRPVTPAELTVTLPTTDLTLRPGENGELLVELHNLAAGPIHGEAQLITPYALWHRTSPWTQPFTVDPGGTNTLRYQVTAPPDTRPGHWWALVKVMYFGRLHYTPTVSITVAEPATPSTGPAARATAAR